MSNVLSLLMELIACQSITPHDANCQKIISDRLTKANFTAEHMQFAEVKNVWLRYGKEEPLIVFAGHTDVVPPGPLAEWHSPPFEPTVKDGKIYGRGACDMKGSLAAMIIAAENFVTKNPNFKGSIAFLITSDEEGASIDGTEKVIATLVQRGVKINYAIVGEASSIKQAGDQIRIGRRGSLHGKLKITGKQGHVAFPDLAINPIHKSMVALDELATTTWDQGNDTFPPTSFQITQLHAGVGAANVIPPQLDAAFNFRFGTASSVQTLQDKTKTILDKINLPYQLTWHQSAAPFLTQKGKLITIVQKAIKKIAKIDPILSTGGGTSDARFIAPTGAEVIELGVPHETAHQINEYTTLADLDLLEKYYQEILSELFATNESHHNYSGKQNATTTK